MYSVQGDKVFYSNGVGEGELFLTVHPTRDCTKTLEEQALTIAMLLNDLPSVKQ